MWEEAAQNGRKRRIIVIIAVVTIVALSIALTTWRLIQQHDTSLFPASIRQNSKVSLFYPTKLPSGYVLEPSTVQRTNGVITFAAKKGSKYINFSIQPRADKFDFETFYSTLLVKSFKFITPLGEATVGSLQTNGNTVGSLIDGNTWAIVSAPASVTPNQVQAVIDSFTKAN